jgi:hypothetical protein
MLGRPGGEPAGAGLVDANEHGWVLFAHAQAGGGFDVQTRLYEEAIATARECRDVDLECEAVASLGIMLACSGCVAEGMARLDEALAAICAGEVDDLSVVEGAFCRLFNALDAVGLAENTIVPVLADRGDLLGERGFCYLSSSCHLAPTSDGCSSHTSRWKGRGGGVLSPDQYSVGASPRPPMQRGPAPGSPGGALLEHDGVVPAVSEVVAVGQRGAESRQRDREPGIVLVSPSLEFMSGIGVPKAIDDEHVQVRCECRADGGATRRTRRRVA